MDAGIAQPLFPACLLSSPLLATTETTWLPVSGSTSCPNHPAAAATHSPTALSFPRPCTALLCPQDGRDTTPAQEVSVPRAVLHREVEPP